MIGFGFDRDVLLEAGIEQANALAAVTSGDNTNILAARIARETFDIPHVVARIYDPRRALIYQRLGIPTVATVSWTVDQVMRACSPRRVLRPGPTPPARSASSSTCCRNRLRAAIWRWRSGAVPSAAGHPGRAGSPGGARACRPGR